MFWRSHACTWFWVIFLLCMQDFITSNRVLHEVKSFKYFAESLTKDGEIGAAIGVLRRILNYLEKNTPKEETWKLVFKQVKEELSTVLRKYEHENEIVWHEKIPHHLDIGPEPTKIVSSIPYKPQRSTTNLVFQI